MYARDFDERLVWLMVVNRFSGLASSPMFGGWRLVKAESLVRRCALAGRSAQIDGSDVSIFEDRIQQ